MALHPTLFFLGRCIFFFCLDSYQLAETGVSSSTFFYSDSLGRGRNLARAPHFAKVLSHTCAVIVSHDLQTCCGLLFCAVLGVSMPGVDSLA